jgi:hypothetical protein
MFHFVGMIMVEKIISGARPELTRLLWTLLLYWVFLVVVGVLLDGRLRMGGLIPNILLKKPILPFILSP